MYRQIRVYPGYILMCPGEHVSIVDKELSQLLFKLPRQVRPYSGYSIRVINVEDDLLEASPGSTTILSSWTSKL